METLGQRLRRLRTSHRYDQVTVADLLGVANTSVCQWESGQRNPKDGHLAQLAELYGVTPRYLRNGTDPHVIALHRAMSAGTPHQQFAALRSAVLALVPHVDLAAVLRERGA